jgi:DNA-binding NarL/FixJ family response regulator
MTGDGRIAVAIVEDHPVFRQGLAGLVEDEPDLALDVAVRSVPELDSRLRDGPPPGLLVLDLSLSSGGPQGTDAVRAVCERGLRVLVVSASSDRATVVAAIAAGANGYVGKSAEPQEIVRAMHTVAGGASYLSPTLAGYLLDDVQAIKLTDREADVLRLLAAGDTDVDIAEELVISVNTVHSHLDRIRAKTGLHRRVLLTRYAIDRGLMPPSPLL